MENKQKEDTIASQSGHPSQSGKLGQGVHPGDSMPHGGGHPGMEHLEHPGNMDFMIRRLDRNCYWMKCPMHPTRAAVHCFFYLSKGTVLVDIGEKTYLIQAHEFAIVPAGQVFAVRYYENSEGYMGGFHTNCISDDVMGENVLKRFDFLRVWGYPKIELDILSSTRIASLFNRIYEESVSDEMNKEIIRVYLMALLVEADAIYKKTVKQVVSHNDNICNKFLERLFNGERAKLSASGYADLLNISPNHLNKVVKKVTYKSPSVWIEEAMMLDAKVLLRNTDMPLGEISAAVGMMDQSYFARRFKMHEKMTPSEYRQVQRNDSVGVSANTKGE